MAKPRNYQTFTTSAKHCLLPALLPALVLVVITFSNLAFQVKNESGNDIHGSCQQQVENETNAKEMVIALMGRWIDRSSGFYLEEWSADDDTLMVGAGITLKNGVKTIEEILAIVAEPTGYYYLATVSGQNQGRTIRFGPAYFSAKEVVFQNLEHDFPNTLRYYFENDSSLMVSVESVADTTMNFVLNMKKIKGLEH